MTRPLQREVDQIDEPGFRELGVVLLESILAQQLKPAARCRSTIAWAWKS